MHLIDRMNLPEPYRARPYVGAPDHTSMAEVLASHRERQQDPERPTAEQMDVAYAHLTDCDPDTDIAIIEAAGDTVAYCRASWADRTDGLRDCIVFTPTHSAHIAEPLFTALADAQEAHMQPWAEAAPQARFMAFSSHPGPGLEPTGEAAWLEARGYEATEWGASLVRPHLDDIPERELPDGVEVRPVTPDQMRPILEAHMEDFRGEWDFREPTAEDTEVQLAEPHVDPTLWKVAWAGDQIVGQVKSYINTEENEARGYLRGYTENISTHHDWRNRGIAGALLAMSLHELKNRGMTEAALGVDTNNPGGAFQLYTGLGFELRAYEAVYVKPVG